LSGHFPFGLGFGNAEQYVYTSGLTHAFWGTNNQLQTLHSVQLQFLLETGLGGALVLVLMIAVLVRTGATTLSARRRPQPETSALWLMVFVLFVSLAIITEPTLELLMFTLFGALLGGMQLGERAPAPRHAEPTPRPVLPLDRQWPRDPTPVSWERDDWLGTLR
jgi:O-antigen ligase